MLADGSGFQLPGRVRQFNTSNWNKVTAYQTPPGRFPYAPNSLVSHRVAALCPSNGLGKGRFLALRDAAADLVRHLLPRPFGQAARGEYSEP